MEHSSLPLDLALTEGLAARVRSARKAARMTQKALADACGLERTSVTNLEAGRQIPKLAALYRMAEALKMRPDELLGNLAGPAVCCGDWASCRQPCVPRANHWQAEAHRMTDRVHQLQGVIAQRALDELRADENSRYATGG